MSQLPSLSPQKLTSKIAANSKKAIMNIVINRQIESDWILSKLAV